MTMRHVHTLHRMLAVGAMATLAVPPASAAKGGARTQPGTAAAIDVVRDYYRAIDARDYVTAWAKWGDRGRPGQTYAAFRRGFATTRQVRVSVTGPARSEGAAGSTYVTVPVRVDGLTTTGAHQRFDGNYVVRRVNAEDSTSPSQRRWHLYSATLRAR
ncbi:hypothetical protein U1872_21655 [Sphingomonas sp. RB3P16]|uniref:hypothetical protein n=1 Tax=Parasphingomonas frigoris TaxID=3096163 RepID=UPI002FCBB811